MKIPKWSIILVLVLTTLSVSAWQSWQWWTWASAAPVPQDANPAQKPLKLQISEGTSAQEIGRDLQTLGVIRSTIAWNLWTRWLLVKEPEGGFKAGTYQLSPTESLPAIASKIWAGDVVNLTITIPEGWSIRQIAAYLEREGFFSAQDFLTAVDRMPLDQYPWLPANRSAGVARLEGFLFPDTYQLAAPIQPESVIRQMLDRFEQVALPLYEQKRGQAQLSFAQWVNLSSIVEKEAVIAAERPRIAGVFLNRLKKGIPLGADPTVEYGLGVQQTPDNPLTLEQVRTPSPYNTYINAGLPPSPISSPGLASLKSVLSPEATDYLYFVARYDGTHVFSRTLAEHQTAQTAIHNQRKTSSNP